MSWAPGWMALDTTATTTNLGLTTICYGPMTLTYLRKIMVCKFDMLQLFYSYFLFLFYSRIHKLPFFFLQFVLNVVLYTVAVQPWYHPISVRTATVLPENVSVSNRNVYCQITSVDPSMQTVHVVPSIMIVMNVMLQLLTAMRTVKTLSRLTWHLLIEIS